MAILNKKIKIITNKKFELLRITGDAERFLKQSEAQNGELRVFSMHTTASPLISENEDGLKEDLLTFANHLESLEETIGGYKHNKIDNNASAHILCSFLGNSVSIPVIGGKAVLGRWQDIFLFEMDGPRTRELIFFFNGETGV